MQKLIVLMFSVSLGFGANYFQSIFSNLSRSQESSGSLNIQDTLRMLGIMAQFPLENPDKPKTSGNGQFLSDTSASYINFFDSNISRCEGFLVDRPPHNSLYFQKQIEAVGNYYESVSDSNLFYTAEIIENPDSTNGYYTVSHEMEYYAKSDQLLAQFFTEVLDSAKDDVTLYLTANPDVLIDDIVFVVFHAGLSQDFSYPSLDPTIYDLKSAYLDSCMYFVDTCQCTDGMAVTPTKISNKDIYEGILLPETQNIIYYDVVEDIIGNPDYGIDDLCDYQYGLTGIFAFLLGYELGLPPMFNNDCSLIDSGDPRIGYFGLMDHGSNNGRGVIPASPSPWTRSLPDLEWSFVDTITPLPGMDTTFIVYTLDTLKRIDISENEYFIIENRNNWVYPEIDIDSLRRKNKINNNVLGHWFDSVVDEFPYGKIKIDEDTQIIMGFDHYDYGLPGSGILIWHIKEPDPSSYYEGVNNLLDNRHVQIEEADGAQDIGTKSYALFSSDDPTTGTRWDMWFFGNEGYEHANSGRDKKIIFDNRSNPNTKTTDGAKSFLSITILPSDTIITGTDTTFISISDSMYINITFNDEVVDEEIKIVNLSVEPVQYLGNAYDSDDSTAAIFYEKDGLIFKHSSDSVIMQIDTLNYIEGNLIYTYKNKLEYHDGKHCIHPLCEHIVDEVPHGYIDSINVSIPVQQALSLGDIDLDGLDEIITIEDGNMFAQNSNGILVNGFPADGNFSGVPLIANILSFEYGNDVGEPEIICREGDDIVILSNRGERLLQLSSFDIDQPLAMVPFWNRNKMALIDGFRLFLFDLDMDHSYWMNPNSRPSGFPLSTGLHEQNASRNFRKQAYNYPNPITEGKTTLRFYIGSTETTEVQVKIYNAAGYLVKDDLIQDVITAYEFNEIKWDNIQVDAGLYFAEIKPDVGQSELVRLVVIK